MPTITGLRRRGYTPASIRNFCNQLGVAKRDNIIDFALLEFHLREDLNKTAWRRMVVFNPVKIILTNYEGEGEIVKGENNPEAEPVTYRDLHFSRELLIERDDFMEVPAKKYFRLAPGQMVRLKSAYIIKCESVVKDGSGNITELHCTYIPESKSGSDTSGISVKGTLHWVNARDAVEVEVREYDRLFKVEDPGKEEGDFKDHINENSLQVVKGFAEPAMLDAMATDRFQFLRKGYYCLDRDSSPGKLIFNRTVTLKDGWVKKV
jgi:glutaminyl-tRNA synthetase